MKARVVSATEFKAKCLAMLDEVEEAGASITVTRRGRPVAVLGPTAKGSWQSPRDKFADQVTIRCDLSNLDTSDLWDVVSET